MNNANTCSYTCKSRVGYDFAVKFCPKKNVKLFLLLRSGPVMYWKMRGTISKISRIVQLIGKNKNEKQYNMRCVIFVQN